MTVPAAMAGELVDSVASSPVVSATAPVFNAANTVVIGSNGAFANLVKVPGCWKESDYK
jgi:hypothetical protein